MKFAELDLHPMLNAAVEKLGFAEATPVQAATIPHILEGSDLAGLAQTGTGKTAAFLLPLMERIIRARENPEQLSEGDKEKREKRMFPDWRANQFILVLVPTRELADQVYETALKFIGESGMRAVSIYGGVSYDKQKEGLRNGCEFVIATPGRLIDLFKEHLVDLKQVRGIVFDEADRMFDMGFKDDMKFILQRVPKERQFMVFSATLNLDVMNTAYQFGANPVEVNVSRDQAKAENVEDKIFHVGQDEKGPHLLSLLKLHKPRQTIVFSNFKMNVPRITQFLNDNGVPAVGISSLLTQSQRTRVMEQFKGDSEHNVLIATDVAARGLDIKGVDMVVNFELPDDPENYVHRIGRTGRAGAKGIAFSLVSERDVDALSRVEQYLKHKIDQGYMEEADLVKEFKKMTSDRGPRQDARPGGSGGRGGERSGGRGGERGEKTGGRGGRSGGEGRRERPPRAAASAADGSEVAPGSTRPAARAAGAAAAGEAPAAGAGRSRREGGRSRRGGATAAVPGVPGAPASRPQPRDPNKPIEARTGGPSRPQAGGARNGSNRKSANGNGSGRPVPKGSKPQVAPSLGKKVTGFFKRLFGG